MSLVAYECSSSDSEDEDSGQKAIPTALQRTTTSSKSSNSLSNLSVRKNDKSKKIEIFLPDFEELASSSSDDEPDSNRHKMVRPSNASSKLFEILPPPQSRAVQSTSQQSDSSQPVKATCFIPHTLAKKRPVSPERSVKRKIKEKDSQDDDDNDELPSFFSFDVKSSDSRRVEPAPKRAASAIPVDIAPQPQVEAMSIEECTPSTSSIGNERLSENQFKKLAAQKFGDVPSDQIQLVDVKVDDHLFQNREYIKSISAEQEVKISDDHVNSTHKRKNHITHLAFQARKQEISLKNQWSKNKSAQNASRAKYGF